MPLITDVRVTSFALADYERPYWNAILTTRHRALTFVEVETDSGETGLALAEGRTAAYAGPLRERLLGQDPLDSARLWHRMFTGWRKPVAKGDAIAAIGGVDNALWDLRGKLLGLPVYRLLGGFRSRVPVYAAGGYYEEGKGIDGLVAELERFVAAGYKNVKMKIGGASFAEDVERVHAAREAVGADVGLMIDANNAWNSAEALRFIRAVEDCTPMWFEEPCWPDDLAGMAELRRATAVPIASGEIEYTRWGARDLIESGAVDIVQADPQTGGGLTEWVRIAALASARHLPMAPHGDQYVGAHAVAAVDNGMIVESYAGLRPWQEDYVTTLPVVDGELVLPDTPGLGIEVDWDRLRQDAERVG
ncbi:mandelate racemase/muconate lactonizing enzyme family protein [Gryllotalpicola reticulitermitis]|uniref:Mandelate racemase/muconate lactonizing enzyme family protein n=1 Tax=Gryllotalpicola reticulitermitis TaxID=1184153 RepID=A0ABV8Q992_9MICO